MNKPRYHSLPAFSLIEIMVVVSMVTVGFISVVGLVQKAIVLYYNNKNVLIANNLAQEGSGARALCP
jgi:type II secretory pathway pseudopilin PulG